MFYIVLETQVLEEGRVATMSYGFENYDAALAKLYTVLAVAAASDLPYHAGHILRSDGILTDGRVFDRRGA